MKKICIAVFFIFLTSFVYAQEENINLISEWESLSNIPKDKRSIEDWERIIEILFQISYNYNGDINIILNSLQEKISIYESIINQMDEDIYNIQKNNSVLLSIIDKQLLLLSEQEDLLLEQKNLINNLYLPNKTFFLHLSSGIGNVFDNINGLGIICIGMNFNTEIGVSIGIGFYTSIFFNIGLQYNF